jgi:hypothetical protein
MGWRRQIIVRQICSYLDAIGDARDTVPGSAERLQALL